MQRSLKNLIGYTIAAIDGESGKLYEFFFHDTLWTVRYLSVELGRWIPEREALVSAASFGIPDWKFRKFPVKLTKEQIGNGPDLNANKNKDNDLGFQVRNDPHLHGTLEFLTYHLHATDGKIGHVGDLIVDDLTWNISHLVIKTHSWWPGKTILVSTDLISKISSKDEEVYVNLTRERIKDSPEYDPSSPTGLECQVGQPKSYNENDQELR